MKAFALRAFAAVTVVSALFVACGDKTNQQEPLHLSKRGESCQSSNDCDSSLVCVKGTCSVGSYNLQPTGKQCVLIACHEAKDCCPKPLADCPNLLAQCEAGLSFDCQTYLARCSCDGSKYRCDDGKCNAVCTPSDGITLDSCRVLGASFTCVANKCVECTKDTDCAEGAGGVARGCKDNKCQIKCAKDADCDPFYKCDAASSACVYSGCKTNLECISKSGNPLAVCNAGKCDVPCQSDPECGTTTAVAGGAGALVTAGLQVCVNTHCVDVGCDSDDQCRILNRLPGGSPTTAECRAVATP